MSEQDLEAGHGSAGGQEEGLKIGHMRLAAGVSYRHAMVGIYASLTTISLMVFINIIQPYLLIHILKIPFTQLGATIGRLGALHEVVAIASMGVIGALSDQWGRKFIYSAAFLLMGFGYFLYPLADSLSQLAIIRVIFAAGSATALVMFTTLAVDYSHLKSRGNWIGFVNLISGIGVLIMALVLAGLPARLEGAGFEAPMAARYVFWIAAALCICSAIVLALGLKKKSPDQHARRSNPLSSIVLSLKIAAGNRKLAFSYGAAFIGRGDLAIIGMFLPAWVSYSAAASDLSVADATARAGILLFAHQIMVVAWAFVAGYLCDRFDKITLLALAFVIASLGYFSLWAVEDPFSDFSLIAIMLLAIGEISIVVTNGALAGEQAPAASRGAVIGLLGVFGGIGIALSTLLGGEIFDGIGPTGPFLMMVALNSGIIVWGLTLRRMASNQASTP